MSRLIDDEMVDRVVTEAIVADLGIPVWLQRGVIGLVLVVAKYRKDCGEDRETEAQAIRSKAPLATLILGNLSTDTDAETLQAIFTRLSEAVVKELY